MPLDKMETGASSKNNTDIKKTDDLDELKEEDY